MTQRDMIADYMERHGSISSWEAIKEFGVTRLSARIFELKERGYLISKERVTTKNRYGKSVTYDKYKIVAKLGGNNE